MFCKPPCPDEHELSPVADDSDERTGLERSPTRAGHHAFGRSIAPDAAGPERGLPPAFLRTG